jgi:hypothetical protein
MGVDQRVPRGKTARRGNLSVISVKVNSTATQEANDMTGYIFHIYIMIYLLSTIIFSRR